MINRQNYQDVKDFLSFHEGTLQNDKSTISRMRGALRHLLEWADEKPFGLSKNIEPTFPAYLARKKISSGESFSFAGGEKHLSIARQFFNHARLEWQARYKNISTGWIETIHPSKRNSSHSRLKEHKHYTLEDILKIVSLSASTVEIQRDIAGVAFLFLSGMRIAAFTSLPLECVNIAENEILQLPEKGVMTKNRKAAKTHLLQIPELLKVVSAWDSFIRSKLSENDLWYPVMARGLDRMEAGKKAHSNRGKDFSKRLRAICEFAGVQYLSPHKIRHGHVVYALKNAKDISDLKAISQNVMHSSIQITDSIYGSFSSSDVKRVVSSIGNNQSINSQQPSDLENLLKALLLNPETKKLIDTLSKGK